MVHRVAGLDKELCFSKKCGLECIKYCPENKMGEECIILGADGKALISEELCTGCGICIKKCPFEAITIVNLAEELKKDKVHQYGVNSFRLYRLPIPRKGKVIGLVGRNGVGKSTTLNVLSGNTRPNLGRFDDNLDWDEVIENYHGTELKDHFEKIARGELKVATKPQAIYLMPKLSNHTAREILAKTDSRGIATELIHQLGLEASIDQHLAELSGGELQRLAVAMTCSKEADLYLFDEPSSYNDVYQRLAVSNVIQDVARNGKSVILVEHDLTFLDYLSDYIHVLYGEPGTYGIVSGLQSSRVGINALLEGYLPVENVRFRDKPVTFQVYAPQEDATVAPVIAEYPALSKRYPGFDLTVNGGKLKFGEVIGVLGGNALGKTTFMKLVSGIEKPDSGGVRTTAMISYKPQYLTSDYEGTVQDTIGELLEKSSGLLSESLIQPLGLKRMLELRVKDLSGGELQRVAIATCLLRDADVYALDEPSAFIDVEDRMTVAKAIQRYIKSRGKSAIIVDHDIQLIDIVSDSLMIFSGESGRRGVASTIMGKEEGMNSFLKSLGITYRRDIQSGRPRVNKPGSKLDRTQKESREYYYLGRVPAESIEE